MLRRSVPDGEESQHFALERALNAALAELGDLLDPCLKRSSSPSGRRPARRRWWSDATTPRSVGQLQALEDRVAEMEQRARAAVRQATPVVIAKQENHYALVRIEQLKVNLGSLVTIAASIRAELRAQLIDLDWLAQLTKQVGELAEALKGGADALRRVGSKLADLLAEVGRVWRLAERVIAGGRTLLRVIKRVVADRAESEHGPRPGTIFRDVDAP